MIDKQAFLPLAKLCKKTDYIKGHIVIGEPEHEIYMLIAVEKHRCSLVRMSRLSEYLTREQ